MFLYIQIEPYNELNFRLYMQIKNMRKVNVNERIIPKLVTKKNPKNNILKLSQVVAVFFVAFVYINAAKLTLIYT